MKNRLFISEEEKNRILNLHKKQILKETTNHNSKLIREQEEKEIERLLALLDPNDPDPIKWQDIVNKIEAMGEDVITYIRKMKDKELAKKFGRWLKNNFNKVKFQQAADNVVSFFKNLGKKKPTPGPTPTPEPTPPPTPTPTEDPNAWKEDSFKQREWLLSNGVTEEDIQTFEQKGTWFSDIFDYFYYEPISSGQATLRNFPKNIEQYRELLKTLGFEPLVYDAAKFKKIFSTNENSSALNVNDYLKQYISKYKLNETDGFSSMENIQINLKTRVISFESFDSRRNETGVTLLQVGFKNYKTGVEEKPIMSILAMFPLVNLKYHYFMKPKIEVANKMLFNPEKTQYEDYENDESMQDDFDYVRSWWFENGRKKFDFIDGETWGIDESGKKTKIYDQRMRGPIKGAVTKDFNELEEKIKNYFKDEELQKMLQKLEQLKNEARRLQFYD